MFGKIYIHEFVERLSTNIARGAYCSMVMVSLLSLPLELPPNSKAMVKGDETFMTGVPEYLSRCTVFTLRALETRLPTDRVQVRPSKVVYPVLQGLKLMERMRFVP